MHIASKFKELEGGKVYVLLYLAVLGISHLVIWITAPHTQNVNGAENGVMLSTVLENHTLSDEKVRFEYQDIYSGDLSDPPILLFIPGGPEGSEVFDGLKSALVRKYRIIIPNLPGYGDSKKGLPDYSFETMSVYINQLLDRLDLSSVHVLGYGLGGASAIYLAHDYDQRVQSLSLVSSIGVQELELLGSYRLNHAVHGIQLSAVWLIHNAIPHFGLINLWNIDVSYAKSLYESDQRPIRSYLKRFQKPMLILHGKDDPLVPIAAAREHHRIVPQSILNVYDAGHDLVETHVDTISISIERFIANIEMEKGTYAAMASKARIEQAQKPFSNVKFVKFKGASLLIIMLVIILSTFVSEDLTCIGSGLLAAKGLIGFWPATAACFIGIFIGDMGLYLGGRFLGRSAINRVPFKWLITEKDLKKSAHWFNAKGPAIIMATRFLPGSRLPTYFSAGIIGAGFWMFSAYFLLAAVVWTPMLVGISKLMGNELLRYFSLYRDYAAWVFLSAVVFLILIVKVFVPFFSYKGRRLLLSRYRRLTRWEYWSPVILYLPVFIYVIYLGIKYRCILQFTATNPAIPDSGFIGESKKKILDLFDDGENVATYRLIASNLSPGERIKAADTFMRFHGLDFPIVIKPDVGQRGKGVHIFENRDTMKQYLAENSQDLIIQQYIEGEEFGVFYYRKPDEREGNVFSVTTKKFLRLKGDGEKTVEELILEDDRAVDLAKFHLNVNEEKLYHVPDEDELIPIVELGTHARGAVFFDGQQHITEGLVKKMDKICKPVKGFYFGRFDIKVPSADSLRKGKCLDIIEINGVTSESTNIYDPGYSFIEAQGILFSQWELAYEIGSINQEYGYKVSSFFSFLKRVVTALAKS